MAIKNDISGAGLQILLKADETFPNGITLTQFADDADAVDIPALALTDKAMGLNGDLVSWQKAVPIEVTVNVISNSDDDISLDVLANANRISASKRSAKDNISMVINYIQGNSVSLKGGRIQSGILAKSVASAGRLKTSAYVFYFQDISENRQ